MRIVKIILIGAGMIAAGGLIAIPAIMSRPVPLRPDALMGSDFFHIRREALALFPRGSRLKDTAEGLVSIGFRCEGISHKLPNVNAASLECQSHGRGYPQSPALDITVMARNGLISDFEVWNILQRADAETVEPPPTPPPHDPTPGPEGKPGKAE